MTTYGPGRDLTVLRREELSPVQLCVSLDDGRVVEIRWRHNQYVFWLPDRHEEACILLDEVSDEMRLGTICRIDILADLGGMLVSRSAIGLAAVHPKDTYNRWVGRRVSLARAMKGASGVTGFSKRDREQVWIVLRGREW